MLSLIKQKRENIHKSPVLAYRFSNPYLFYTKSDYDAFAFPYQFYYKNAPIQKWMGAFFTDQRKS